MTGDAMLWVGLFAGASTGAFTALAGAGGGVLLVASLGAICSPGLVLAATAPALGAGNLTRAWALRREVPAQASLWLLAGTVPAAALGALLAAQAPERLLAGLLGLSLLAEAWKGVKGKQEGGAPKAEAGLRLTGLGAVSGALSGLLGGAGGFLVPQLSRLGWTPLAVTGAAAWAMTGAHFVKSLAYPAAGLGGPGLGALAAGLVAGQVLGNLVGTRWLRTAQPQAWRRWAQAGLVVGAAGMLAQALLP